MRVNARLDETTQQQLEYLTEITGQSVSHVVRESVARYYVEVKAQQPRPPLKFLELAGKYGSGRSDISSNVRHEVATILDAKYPQHPQHARRSVRVPKP
jgi:hypothetical protein